MTPEELLEPRYKVIALWPSAGFEIGQILHNLGASAINYYKAWPHLFKPLEWWEERKPEDMPAYVKDTGHNKYLKVDRYDEAGKFSTAMRMFIEPHSWAVIPNVMCFFEPATESEYLNSLTKVNPT